MERVDVNAMSGENLWFRLLGRETQCSEYMELHDILKFTASCRAEPAPWESNQSTSLYRSQGARKHHPPLELVISGGSRSVSPA